MLEFRVGIQYAPSPSYKKFNPEEIGRQVELEIETPPTLLRLKDKFHNSFELLESGFDIQYASAQGYTKFNRDEIGRQVEQCVGERRCMHRGACNQFLLANCSRQHLFCRVATFSVSNFDCLHPAKPTATVSASAQWAV